MTAYLFLAALLNPDPARLGHPDWPTREATERALRLMGPLAVPSLLRASSDESPEVRMRAARLLAPWRGWAADLRAAAVLLDPWPVDPAKFYADRPLRERVRRLMRGQVFTPWQADNLVPDDTVYGWILDYCKPEAAVAALWECRDALGVKPVGWPFDR